MTGKQTVREYIEALGDEIIAWDGDTSRVVTGVTYNSKEAGEGSLFVCKGAAFREEYLSEAELKGAAAFVREGSPAGPEEGCTGIYVKDIRRAMPLIAETFYGRLSDDLKMVGVTGTKGKSTTCFFIRSILDDYMRSSGGHGCAMVSGIGIDDGVVKEEASLTTPEVIDLYRHMHNAVSAGSEYLAMEVSSQALKYGRVSGIVYEAGAFLNIGNDHISDIEHPDAEDYLRSKLLLMKQCRKACFNLDSAEQEKIRAAASECPEVITFSQRDESADVFAYDIRSDEGTVTLKIRALGADGKKRFDSEFRLGTFGTINVENALAAVSLAVLLGVPEDNIRTGLAETAVPGRMEVIRGGDGRRIAIVDFAHNELSFERFFETVREEFPGKKIISVFGATGDKGINRRTGMGHVAGRCSDYSIITEDDPGHEDVAAICSHIAGCIEEEGGSCEIITDRQEAIRRGVELMDDDTILFAAGRGREELMKRGDAYVSVPTDVDLVKRYMQ